jgi:hypothetical protein
MEMSRNKWAPRQVPTEYRSRAPLSERLLDIVAQQITLNQQVGAISEEVRRLETRKAARDGNPEAA